MNIQKIKIEKLIPALYNPRKDLQPGDPEYEKLKRSMQEFGYVEPIVWNKRTGNIVGGHQRYKILLDMGMQEVDCVVVDLDETKEKALNLALNKIQGDWDYLKLKDVLQDLDTGEFDIELTGFDLGEIEDLMTQFHVPGEIVEDDAPEPPEEPISKPGDLWILGRHRLLCGDATKKEDVERLMDGKKADMVFTDPPYGVNRDKGFGGEMAFRGGTGNKIKRRVYEGEWDNETPPQEAFDNLLKNSKEAIVWGGNFFTDKLPVSGFWLVWDKHQTMPTFGDCELAWTNIPRKSVKKYDVVYNGLIGKEKERFHPTQKPVKLCVDVLSDLTEENALVLDLFGGSGSTLIACEQLNRTCYMMELDPIYCDVIIKRWENFTGQKAMLADV